MKAHYRYDVYDKDGNKIMLNVNAGIINEFLGKPSDNNLYRDALTGKLIDDKIRLEVVGNDNGLDGQLSLDDRRRLCSGLFGYSAVLKDHTFDMWVRLNERYGTRWKK